MRLWFKYDKLPVERRLRKVLSRMDDLTPAMTECGLVLLGSVARNFKDGGRPVRWKPSARAAAGGKTLIDTARLKNSMTMRAGRRHVAVGTNVAYAAIHQFGGRINKTVAVRAHRRLLVQVFGHKVTVRRVRVRAHSRKMDIKIPARPFLMVQDEDKRIMRRILGDYICLRK